MMRNPFFSGGRPARGQWRWIKPLVYAVLLIFTQGVLSRLADAAGVPAPDLFLLTAAALAWRLPPRWALVAAFGVGLAQDLLGGGAIGLHAAGLAGGAYLVLFVRRYFADSGPFQAILTVLSAVVGQWLTFIILSYWLRKNLVTADLIVKTVPLIFLGTLLISPLWERVMAWGMGSKTGPQESMT